jgi:hypothetical protein
LTRLVRVVLVYGVEEAENAEPTKSSNSTLCGIPVGDLAATYFTSGAYCLMKKS